MFQGDKMQDVSPVPCSSHFLPIHLKGTDSATLIGLLDTLKKKKGKKKSPKICNKTSALKAVLVFEFEFEWEERELGFSVL